VGIGVLGPLVIDDRDVSLPARDRVVLAALAARAGEVVDAAQLADALWGATVPPSAAKVVQGAVVRLRKALGREAIETTSYGYRLQVPPGDIDAQRFQELLGKARLQLALGEPERASYLLGRALELWRGRAFVDLEHWEPGRAAAVRLERTRREAEELRVDAALEAGHHLEFLAELRGLVAEEPLRERRWALLALAEYRSGRQAEALRTIHQARRTLADEVGLDLGPELRELEMAVLRQDASLVTTVPVVVAGDCPYLGLVPYDVDDAENYFGRAADLARCLGQLGDAGVVVVVGPSGSGKSSLVRAGVCATLQRAGRRVEVLTPGHDAEAAVSAACQADADVVVVDQCEEIATLHADVADRNRALDVLIELTGARQLVVVLRADHLAALTEHEDFARLVERSLVLVTSPGEADLREMIEGPASQAGLLLEPGLVELLIGDVAGQPGALPLLSHALRVTWERREGRTLTVAGYRATGGVRGAVAQSAEQLYLELDERGRALLRDLMLRLVAHGGDGEPTRVRLPRRLAAGDHGRDRLLEQLIESRLVTGDDGVVEIAHEALARAWPRLREWLDDDVEGQRIRSHLAATADGWEQSGRPDSELYRGARLERAQEWRDRAQPALTAAEHDFLETGLRAAESEQRAAQVRIEEQIRVSRRLRKLLTIVAASLAVALVVGALAVAQARRADDASARADRAAAAAEARRVAAQALVVPDIDVAMLLAAHAVRLDESSDTRAGLVSVQARAGRLDRVARTDGASITSLDVSPDGSTVLVGGSDGARAYDAALLQPTDVDAGAVPSTPDVELPPTAQRTGVSASGADGRYVAVGFRLAGRSRVGVWDLGSRDAPMRTIAPPGDVLSIALSPDGSILYVMTTSPDAIVSVDVASGEQIGGTAIAGRAMLLCGSRSNRLIVALDDELLTLATPTLDVHRRIDATSPVDAARCSHDGRTVASASADGTIRLWSVATGDRMDELDVHTGEIHSLAFNPDDSVLFSADDDSLLVAWDLHGISRSLARRGTPLATGDRAGRLLLAPDGTTAALIAESGTLHQLFDLATGEVRPSELARTTVTAAAWRPTGELVTAGTDGVISAWDASSGVQSAASRVASGAISALRFSADGARVLVVERRGAVTLLDAATLDVVRDPLLVDAELRGGALSADAATAAMFTTRGEVRLVDLATGTIRDVDDGGLDIVAGAFAPDGHHLAVASRDGRVAFVDVHNGDLRNAPVAAHSAEVTSLSFDAGGTWLMTSGADGVVAVWNAVNGELLDAVATPASDRSVSATFVGDTSELLIVDATGQTYRWDLGTDAMIEHACAVVGRRLDEQEWQRFFGDVPYRAICP
jgi:WD40 repeat protein/DNA-binding SARP family transcriptional activator